MSINPRGQSPELFFIDGRPDGMLTTEVFDWTGHVLMKPPQLGIAFKLGEARTTNVYLFFREG